MSECYFPMRANLIASWSSETMPLLLLLFLLPGVASAISVDDLVNEGIPPECLAWDTNWDLGAPPPPPDALLADDFSGGAAGWTIVDEGTEMAPSDWQVVNGRLVQYSNIFERDAPLRSGTYALADVGYGWTDYTLDVAVRSDDDDSIGVMFRYEDANNYYRLSWNAQSPYRRLVKVVGGVATLLASDAVPYTPGQSYDVSVAVVGSGITISVDGALVFSVTDGSITGGTVGLYSYGNVGSVFDNVLVR